MDEMLFPSSRRSAPKPSPVDEAPSLFDEVVEVRVPDIKTRVPSAPGSATSAAAAAKVTDPMRADSYRKIMLVLGAIPDDGVLSREELSVRTGIKESSLCGRLSDRELRPDWIEAVESACVSSAGVAVDGYRLTTKGRARLARREDAA